MGTITVLIGDETFTAGPDQPLVFGRAHGDGVVGLDPRDMGISARAGSIEFSWGVWWVVNRSRKRQLLIESSSGSLPHRLDCGGRQAVTVSRSTVLVPGLIYTHRLEVVSPDDMVAALRVPTTAGSGGTITFGDLRLSERDRDPLVALCRRPRSRADSAYAPAADRYALGVVAYFLAHR